MHLTGKKTSLQEKLRFFQ